MNFNLISEKLSKYIFTSMLLSISLIDIGFNKEIYANKALVPANDNDLYLYKGIGASYLCIASEAGVEFPKAVGIATATYVQVLEGKHGGIVKDLGKKNFFDQRRLHNYQYKI